MGSALTLVHLVRPMDPRLLEEASEQPAISRPAFALLALGLVCVAGAVGCHLAVEDLRMHSMESAGYAQGRTWFVVGATVFSLGFAGLVVHGMLGARPGGKRRHRSGSSSRSGRSSRRRSRRRSHADATN